MLGKKMSRGSIYVTDPASVASGPGIKLPFSMFDSKRIMDAIRDGLVEGLPPMEHPNDELLIATLINMGQPKFSADQMRHNPTLRLQFYLVWLDNQAAARGDGECKERVDAIRSYYEQMRAAGTISDRPHGAGGHL